MPPVSGPTWPILTSLPPPRAFGRSRLLSAAADQGNGGNAELRCSSWGLPGVRVRCFRGRISYRGRARRKATYFCDRIHFTRALMSASGTARSAASAPCPRRPGRPSSPCRRAWLRRPCRRGTSPRRPCRTGRPSSCRRRGRRSRRASSPALRSPAPETPPASPRITATDFMLSPGKKRASLSAHRLGEREDLGVAEDVGEQQHQEHDQDAPITPTPPAGSASMFAASCAASASVSAATRAWPAPGRRRGRASCALHVRALEQRPMRWRSSAASVAISAGLRRERQRQGRRSAGLAIEAAEHVSDHAGLLAFHENH